MSETNASTAAPVFIVGMNGSGTTLMLDLLNHHPLLYGFPFETKVLPHFISAVAAGRYGTLEHDADFLRLWQDIAKSAAFVRANNGCPPPIPDDWREKPRSLEIIVTEIFHWFAWHEGKSRFCEKTPMHVLHMQKLSELYPRAKFVHVIRDGRACAASFHRRWGNDARRTIFRWKKTVTEGRKQGLNISDRYLEVRYEDLIGSTEQSMRKVCDFLKIDFDRRVLLPNRTQGLDGNAFGGSYSTVVQPKSDWIAYFTNRQLKQLESLAGGTLTQFGYQPTCCHTDKNPSKVTIQWWTYKEFVKFGLRGIVSAAKKKDLAAFRRLFKKSQEAFRSEQQNKLG